MTRLGQMVRLKKNIKNSPKTKICLLAAGIGTRNIYAEGFVKGLLTLKNKAIISHILDKFSDRYEIVVAVGHNENLYREFLPMAYPKRKFKFVKINPFKGKGSGPGYSLLCCENFLKCNFFLIPSDAYINPKEKFKNYKYNWIGTGCVEDSSLSSYCLVNKKSNNDVINLIDKRSNPNKNLKNDVFTGIAFIYDYKDFFKGLKSKNIIKKEKQVSAGLNALISKSFKKKYIKTWRDLGTSQLYEKFALNDSRQNLLKKDEKTFIYDKVVIKYYKNSKIIDKKVKRAKLLSPLTPKIEKKNKNFFSYNKIKGHLLSEESSNAKFEDLLNISKKTIFKPINMSEKNKESFNKECLYFYKNLTLNRVKEYFKKWPSHSKEFIINKRKYPNFRTIWNSLPWDDISKGIPTNFHGDFQPENIICTQSGFKLIDWRHNFTEGTDYGDLYYDLSKLKHALIINGQIIRDGKYSIKIQNNNVRLSYDKKFNLLSFNRILDSFIKNNDYSVTKVNAITGLIYIRIACLYENEYSNFLYFLGIQYLSKRFL